jgi:hypothetical protein
MNGLIIFLNKQELSDIIHGAVKEAITEYRLDASEKAERIEDIMNSQEAAQFLNLKLNTLYVLSPTNTLHCPVEWRTKDRSADGRMLSGHSPWRPCSTSIPKAHTLSDPK